MEFNHAGKKRVNKGDEVISTYTFSLPMNRLIP